jgi:hypothetical protein
MRKRQPKGKALAPTADQSPHMRILADGTSHLHTTMPTNHADHHRQVTLKAGHWQKIPHQLHKPSDQIIRYLPIRSGIFRSILTDDFPGSRSLN